LSFDTPIKDLIEGDAQLLPRTDVSKADVCRGARPLLSRRVSLIARGLKRPHVRTATESPLWFASVCFPLLPGCRARGGEAEEDPEGLFSAVDLLEENWSGRRDSNPRPRPWQTPGKGATKVTLMDAAWLRVAGSVSSGQNESLGA
jgi:hypothetical protein